MTWQDYPIVGSFNNQNISEIDAERTVNLFEYIDPEGKKPKTLLSTAGLTNKNLTFPSAANGFRAQFVFNNPKTGLQESYIVIGARIYFWDGILPPILLGSFAGSFEGYVGIDANTFQIIFVDGKEGFIFDTSTSGPLVKITDPNFPKKPIDVCFLDGFFVVANGDTNQFQLSMFNQGLVWGVDFVATGGSTGNAFLATSGGSPNLVLSTGTTVNYQIGTPVVFSVGVGGVLPVGTPPIVAGVVYFVKSVVNSSTFTISDTDGGTAITFSTTGTAPIFVSNQGQLQLGQITSHPGTLIACRTLHRRIFFFTQNFTEVWENQGAGTNLPFRRSNPLLMEVGTPSRWSIAVGFDRMFFLAQDKDGLSSIMQVDGTQGRPISNRALDAIFSQYAFNQQITVNDPSSILIKINGLIFYRLNFTLANHTYVYNVSMSQGEEKRWHEEEVLNTDRHLAQTHMYFNGINYYGNYLSPILYVVDTNNNTNDGQAIKRMRIGKAIVDPTYKRMRIDRFHLDLVQGQVDDIPDNTAPTVFFSYSKDGGQSYGNILTASMGQIGERTFRTVWRKLGVVPRGQGFVPKVEFYNQIPFIVLGAAWVFEVLPE